MHHTASAATPTQSAEITGTVLLVGDAASERSTELAALVETHGWDHVRADAPARAVWLASIRRVQLVVVVASGRRALEWLQSLREVCNAPLVVHGDLSDLETSEAVELGGDLVLASDTRPERFLALVRALLRRAEGTRRPAVRYLRSDAISVDLVGRTVTIDDEPVDLARLEYDLLVFLMSHPLRALDAHVIVRRVWDWKSDEGLNTLRIHIGRLRKKLGDSPTAPEYIRSVRGLGYEYMKPVLEFGDDVSDLDQSAINAALLAHFDPLSAILRRVVDASTLEEASSEVVGAIVESGLCDGAAVFQTDAARSSLRPIADAGMSERWRERVAGGVPLSSSFLGVHTFTTAKPSQYADIRRLRGHFADTLELLMGENVHAILFVPLMLRGEVWGKAGFVTGARRPFGPGQTKYLEAIASAIELKYAGLHG